MARKVFVTSDMSADEDLDEIADSDPLAALIWPWFLTSCDDWGRTQASPRRLKNRVFPGNALVGHEEIERALELYEQHGLISRYEVDGVAYFAVPSERWFKWQTHIPREKRASEGSKCPPPPGSPRGPQQPRGTQSPHADSSDKPLKTAEPSGLEPKKVPTPTLSPSPSPSPSEAVAGSARAEKSTADSSSSLFSLVCQSLRVNEGDDVDGLVRDGVLAFSSLRPELEAKRCRLHYPNWMRMPAAWRIGKFIEWMKREERYHAASNVRELPPPKDQPAAELTTYPPSGVDLWDRLRVEFVKDNLINRLMCRRPTDWMFEELHPISFDGTTLRMGTPWPPGHFREEWAGVIRNYCRRLQERPPDVEWVPETAEAMA